MYCVDKSCIALLFTIMLQCTVCVKEVIYVNLCHKSYLKREDYLLTFYVSTLFYIPCSTLAMPENRHKKRFFCKLILMDIFQTMVMLLHILKNVVRKSTISPIYASCKLGIEIIVEKKSLIINYSSDFFFELFVTK